MAIYQLNDYQEFSDQQILNTWWIEGNAVVAADAVAAFVAEIIPKVKDLQVSTLSHTKIGWRQVGLAQPEQFFVPAGWPLAGLNVANGLPPHDALLVTLYAAGGSYPLRARKYIGGVPMDVVDDGIVQASIMDNLQALGQAVLDFNAAHVGVFQIVTFRKDLNDANVVVSYVASSDVARQGSRRRGRGS